MNDVVAVVDSVGIMVGTLVAINCVGFKEIISVDTTEGLMVGGTWVEASELDIVGTVVEVVTDGLRV